ncbi:MAG TPA: GxxExxY protein [Gemmatimonadales bacterium]|nr:GxxExxY protein [Gemmatimonadales bacterium]
MIHHEGTKGTKARALWVSHAVIGAAIEVHRYLAPGLLESLYEKALARVLWLRGLDVRRQVPVRLAYKGADLDSCVRMNLVVQRVVIVEVKSTAQLAPIHRAQLLTYLRLSNTRVGLRINFDTELLRRGIKRMLNG